MGDSEKKIQRDIYVGIGSREDCRIFRNSVGFDQLRNLHYGLCRGSSDLIGITSITITPDMVGRKVGVFTAIEVKAKKGKPSQEQIVFIDVIKKFGGIAGIAKSKEEAEKLIELYILPP